jgi:hypothetical protein
MCSYGVNGTISGVEVLTVNASKSPYLPDSAFLDSKHFSFDLGLSFVKIGVIFTFVVSCTSDRHFVRLALSTKLTHFSALISNNLNEVSEVNNAVLGRILNQLI